MTWRVVPPIACCIDGLYERGVRLARSAFRPIAARLIRSETLPKWSLMINPASR